SDEMRGAAADAVAVETAFAGGDQLRMIRQSEIVVAAEGEHASAVAEDFRALRRILHAAPAIQVLGLARGETRLQAIGKRGHSRSMRRGVVKVRLHRRHWLRAACVRAR